MFYLLEYCALGDEQSCPGVIQVEGEAETPASFFAVDDFHAAGGEKLRQAKSLVKNLQEIVGAAKDHGFIHDVYRERHTDTVADIFFQTCWSCKTLFGMDYLVEVIGASINACPNLWMT